MEGGHDWYWDTSGLMWTWRCMDCAHDKSLQCVAERDKPSPDLLKRERKCDRCHDDYHLFQSLEHGYPY